MSVNSVWGISCIFLKTEVPFIQELSGLYTSPLLNTDELKMALRARKASGAFEKRALDQQRKGSALEVDRISNKSVLKT